MENKQNRLALIGIIIENTEHIDAMNSLLSQYGEFIIGRMGIPYNKRGVSIISVAIDAPADTISALSGKLGALPGVNTKTIYSKV